VFDFRNDVRSYFRHARARPRRARPDGRHRVNNAHADDEMPFFKQEIFELANSLAPGPDDPQPPSAASPTTRPWRSTVARASSGSTRR